MPGTVNTTGISCASVPAFVTISTWIGFVDTPVHSSLFCTNFTRVSGEKLLPTIVIGVVSGLPSTAKPLVGIGIVVSHLACDTDVTVYTTIGVGTITTL